VSRAGSLAGSLHVVRSRPVLWALGLLAFLVRGGAILAIAPIVVLPSAVGIGNVVVPGLTTVVFGGLTPWIVIVLAVSVSAGVVLVIASSVLAAAAEAAAIRTVAVAGSGASPGPVGGRPVGRVVVARWLTSLPLVVALAFGLVRIVMVAYRELTLPSETGVPVAVRVVTDAPEVVVAIGLTWLLGGLLGGLAARRVVLADAGVASALGFAVRSLARHPIRCAIAFGVPLLAFAAVLALAVLSGTVVAGAARVALGDGGPLAGLAGALALVAVWIAGLLFVGVAGAWRSAALTLEVAGTFGGATHGQRGDWYAGSGSATMADLRPRGVDPDPR